MAYQKKSAVTGNMPVTAIYLETRNPDRVIVAVTSLLPAFVIPFYMDKTHALPWLYTMSDEDIYLGKLPIYYIQLPMQFDVDRLHAQNDPVPVTTYYLIPEPDKDYTYIAMSIYKSTYLPYVFKIHKSKSGNRYLKTYDPYDKMTFIFNAKRDQVQRLKPYLKGYGGATLLFPVLHGLPLKNTKALDVGIMFGGLKNEISKSKKR